MPIYTYQIIKSDGSPGATFEWEQKIGDAELKTHPLTGAKVQKVITAANLVTEYSPKTTAAKHAPEAAAKKGFSTYQRDPLTGRYHKLAGSDGPETIERPPPED